MVRARSASDAMPSTSCRARKSPASPPKPRRTRALSGYMEDPTTACVPALTIRTWPASSPNTSARNARPNRSANAERQMFPVQTSSTVNGGESDDERLTATLCGSVRPGTAQDRPDRLPEDHEVKGQRPVLHVADVDAHRVVPGEIGSPADLPEAGKAGLHEE